MGGGGKNGGGGGGQQDPQLTAAQQSALNKEAVVTSSRVNAVEQFAPWGSTTFTKRGVDGDVLREGEEDIQGTPRSQTINLAPAQQELFDTNARLTNEIARSAEGLAGGLPNRAFSLADVPTGLPVAETLFQRRKALLDPELDEIDNRNLTTLTERGIPVGSEVWNLERDRFGRQRDESLRQLAGDAVLGSAAEEDRQLQRKLTERATGINEIAAAMQGSPATIAPSFIPQPAYNAQAGSIVNAQNANTASQNANRSSGGVGQALGGAGALVSALK